jgi:predicted transglutaminase-like cysteine proteinase
VGDVRVASLVTLNNAWLCLAVQWQSATSRRTEVVMTRQTFMLLLSVVACGQFVVTASAADRTIHDPAAAALLVEGLPSLAPFQHVRFCLHYPNDCKSNPTENERIELTEETSALLDRVNRRVNGAIAPVHKSYDRELQEAWTIASYAGDCNDFAVTKRHELLLKGLPAKALRLAVVKTKSGEGHLVLLVATTRDDLVLDNLTEAVVPWHSTDYRWVKIQSAKDARAWSEVKLTVASLPEFERKSHLADRQATSSRQKGSP